MCHGAIIFLFVNHATHLGVPSPHHNSLNIHVVLDDGMALWNV